MKSDLVDSTVLVTGGSGGIGSAICTILANRGARVAIGYHTGDSIAVELACLLSETGTEAMAVSIDVTDPSSVSVAFQKVIRAFGGLTSLVNAAGGMNDRHPIDGMSLALWDSAITLNLTGTFLCIREAIPHLRLCDKASIVNLTSSSVNNGGSGKSVHYVAAKAGIEGLTRGLARELAPGIRVNAVAPGAIDTPFHDRVPPVSPLNTWPEKIPLGRVGKPQDVSEIVAFLVSEMSGFITGQVIHVSGGMVLG